MRKVLGILLLAVGFFSCENESTTSDPGIQAMANNEEFTTGVKFETWRPQYNRASVNQDNILSLVAETDSTRFVLRVPYTLFSNDSKEKLYLGDVGKLGKQEGVEGLAGYAQYYLLDNIDRKVLGKYVTQDSNKEITDVGIVVFDAEEKQVPGTISGTFYANLKKIEMSDEDKNKLTPAQKIRVDKLRDKKSFHDGVFFRIKLEAAK